MQTRHVPKIERRYWFGIVFASIFGTNLGDLYAHESGLGLGFGLLVLAGLFAALYWIQSQDRVAREAYFWVAIIIIRTGATNIADYLAYRVRVPGPILTSGLAAIIAVLAWRAAVPRVRAGRGPDAPAIAATNLAYWGAMLGAGVFGTVLGDICSHRFGQGPASIGLTVMLVVLLAAAKSRVATQVAAYWCAVALARTAGTCIGDFLAENKGLHIGLPISTLLTGTAFIVILTCWRGTPQGARSTA
jgi:uncharacterized membrane-anchored protein